MCKPASKPHQTSIPFDFSELQVSTILGNSKVRESAAALVPEFVPVYTLALRRSDVVTLQTRSTIVTPGDAAALAWEQLKDADREHLLVLLLDTKNRVTGINTVSVGVLDSSLAHPREVFKAAILGNAAAIILAHNHPSGDPTPSQEDKRVTQRLRDAGTTLGIGMLDQATESFKHHTCVCGERVQRYASASPNWHSSSAQNRYYGINNLR